MRESAEADQVRKICCAGRQIIKSARGTGCAQAAPAPQPLPRPSPRPTGCALPAPRRAAGWFVYHCEQDKGRIAYPTKEGLRKDILPLSCIRAIVPLNQEQRRRGGNGLRRTAGASAGNARAGATWRRPGDDLAAEPKHDHLKQEQRGLQIWTRCAGVVAGLGWVYELSSTAISGRRPGVPD